MRRPVIIGNHRSGGLWWRIPIALLCWLVVATPIVATVTAIAILRDYTRDLPRLPDLNRWEQRLPTTTVIQARDGTVLAEIPFTDGVAVGHRQFRALSEVPRVLIEAFIAAEDVRFVSHRGVDVRAVVRAAEANYHAGRVVEGASTITQQLARGLLPEEIGSERSLRRKVREAMTAMRLERRYGKSRLLTTYLNFVFLGAGAYGVDAAARVYFNKALSELEVQEAALIAGLAQAPGRANPYRDIEAARRRRDQVLDRMARAGFIELARANQEQAKAIRLQPAPLRYGQIAGWHTERVRQQLERDWPRHYLRGGFRVVTSAEPALAIESGRRVNSWLERRWNKEPRPQLGALVWDHHTGYVELTLGGRDFASSKFDRATQACRQPGSAFKPFVYTAAIERGVITPGTPLRDAPVAEFDWDLGVHWKPTNSGRSFRGVALAQDALASSLNAAAVDVLDRVGTAAVVELARRVGVSSELAEVRPLALGSSCVVPMELAKLYAAIAAGGRRVPAVFAIAASHRGRLTFDHASPADPYLAPDRTLDRLVASTAKSTRQLLDPGTAFLMRSMLRSVVTRGTAVAARSMARPVAGKTGTTNKNTDAWFAGFTPRLTGVVWLGHDDPGRSLGPRADGGRVALPLWKKLITLAEGERSGGEILGEPPDTIVSARVDRDTGMLARPGAGGALDLFFKAGTEPTASSGHSRDVPVDVHRMTRDF